jgi:hypothetical protein
MSERPRSFRRVVYLLIAVTVLGLGFGGGVLVGRAMRERKHPATEKSVASISAAEAKKELAACRRERVALAKGRTIPPATPSPGEPDDAGLETAAQVEALQKEVDECRVRETLLNAYVCGTIGDHFTLYFVLMHSSRCVEEAGLSEFLAHSLEKCAEFDDDPAHLDEEKLTQVEMSRLVQSKWRRLAAVRYKKDYIADWLQTMRRECRKRWALPDE